MIELFDADGQPVSDDALIERMSATARYYWEQAQRSYTQAASIADRAADDAARRYDQQREGAPIVTIGLDTPIDRIPAYNGDPDADEVEEVRTVRDVIIERAAHLLVQSVGGKTLVSELRDEVRETVTADIQAKVGEIVTTTLDGEIAQTNEWGERVGKVTTLRQMVMDATREWLKNKNTERSNRTGYGNPKPTGAEELIQTTVDAVMKKDLAAEIVAAKAEVKKRVQLSATEVMTEAITNGLSIAR